LGLRIKRRLGPDPLKKPKNLALLCLDGPQCDLRILSRDRLKE
jgi:hypothetical protein